MPQTQKTEADFISHQTLRVTNLQDFGHKDRETTEDPDHQRCHTLFAETQRIYSPDIKSGQNYQILIFTIIVRKTNYIAEISFLWINSAYRHPKKTGFSPGAEHSDSFFKLMMWARADTVAATYHGRPSSEQISTQIPTTNMSKW